MKKNKMLLIIYLCIVLSLFTYSATKQINLEIPGLKIKNMKIVYFNLNELNDPTFYISTNYTKTSQISIISAGQIIFFKKGYNVWIEDVDKKLNNIVISKSLKVIYFKQENTIDVLLSEDKVTWEKLEMKVTSLNPLPHVRFTKTKVFCALYLKCRWFEGEYYLMDSPEIYEDCS